MAPGVTIPFPEKIREEYWVREGKSIRANISFEHLKPLLADFYRALPEPLFLVIQQPLTQDEERRMGNRKVSHQEVLYLNGQTQKQIDDIIKSFGQVLLCDGMSQFAIASHVTHEEIFIQKYKLVDFYSKTPRKFMPLLEKYDIQETQHLVTVWDTFTRNAPGQCRRLSIEGLDSYAVVNALKKKGMYRVEVIED